MSDALAVAQSIQSEYFKASVLRRFLPKIQKNEFGILLFQEFLYVLTYRDRKSFLADIPNLAPAIISLSGGDTKALELVVDAIRDVCRQWP